MNQPKFRSAQWKLIAAVCAMIAALTVVWALIATFTIIQRDRALEQANERITELREQMTNRVPQPGARTPLAPEPDDSWITEQLKEISAEMDAIIPPPAPAADEE